MRDCFGWNRPIKFARQVANVARLVRLAQRYSEQQGSDMEAAVTELGRQHSQKALQDHKAAEHCWYANTVTCSIYNSNSGPKSVHSHKSYRPLRIV